MSTLTIAPDAQAAPRRPTLSYLPLLAVIVVAAADFLMFDQPPGLGWTMLGAVLAVAIVAARQRGAHDRDLVAKSAIAVLALLPLLENVSRLSIGVALSGLAIFAFALSGKLRAGLSQMAYQLLGFFITAPFRPMLDWLRVRALTRNQPHRRLMRSSLLGWAMPLGFAIIFITLFGIANPLVEHWLSLIDLPAWLSALDIRRVVFWMVVACISWAYLRPRLSGWPRWNSRPAVPKQGPSSEPLVASTTWDLLFGREALVRALIVFNAIFALQNVLDIAYLWAGIQLPESVGVPGTHSAYANYAHRGAYPLVATALLAAGFVLMAMRPGSATSRDKTIRTLIYLWVAQNIWLVISSILRLNLYVSEYSLTYLRVAAFLWMCLVAIGLLTIIARIALGRSNDWLLNVNILALVVLIYASCFINFAAFIANYNVDHSREMTGNGQQIDQEYLRSLGAWMIPATDRLVAGSQNSDLCRYDFRVAYRVCLRDARNDEEAAFREARTGWRSWSFRTWRLERYLDGVRHDAAAIMISPKSEGKP